jgi:hypothetical protein
VPKEYADLYEKEVKELVEKYKGIKNKDELLKAVKSEIKNFIENCDKWGIINLAIYAWEREMTIYEEEVSNALYFEKEFAMDEGYLEELYQHPLEFLSNYSSALLPPLFLFSVIREINPKLVLIEPKQESE